MSKKESREKEKPGAIRSFLTSVRLTFGLLVLIALAAAAGTVAPSFDVYHSVWFSVLLGLLSLNLIACSWQRFPASRRRFRAGRSPGDASLFDNISPDRILMLKGEMETIAGKVENIFRKKYGRVVKQQTSEGTFLRGEKGAFSHFGVYIVHFGVLLVIAGALIGVLFGFTATVNIVEGEAVDRIHIRGEKDWTSLGFAVRLDRFQLDYYDNGMPKMYRSDLTFVKDGRILFQGPLLVNHPVVVEGLRFYQSSYGTAGGDVAWLVIRRGKQETLRKVQKGDRVKLPGSSATAEVVRMEENLMQMGPAVKLHVQSQGRDVQFWVFQYMKEMEAANPGLSKMVPQFNPGLFEPYVFDLRKVEGRFFSGLQVTRDPGAPVVAGGAAVMVAGFMVAFFLSHRRLMIRMDKAGSHIRIAATGSCSKDPRGLDREIRHFLQAAGKIAGKEKETA